MAHVKFPWCLAVSACALNSTAATSSSWSDAPPAAIRVYSHLLDPREHPDDDRRPVRPPDWATFKHRTQFTVLRGFHVENDVITGYAAELEKFTRTHALGEVVWPSYPILFAKNLGDLADEIARHGLYLFDVWGYVPGSGPGGYWQQFRPPREAFALLEAKLGDRWLGTDIGEQDGRYIGGYANQMTPASGDRFAQYLNFQRHFERMGDDLGHKHATLVSLNFGHYFLKEGTYTLIGAETAQALPNSQVYYAFIRGAGKQYGVPWFGNASIYNRWGFKTYGSSGRTDGYDFGPTKGSSLSLLKRLLYSHILYNCVAVGFENMWFEGDQLSPIGRIQQAAQRWVQEHGQPGVLHTPVALLLDFYSGWSFPRHLYTDKLFRVWGNLPYADSDHLTDALLELLYPGYADASYFHDESGFLTATPYGDIADCLLTDAPLWVLERYPVVILGGATRGGAELHDKLRRYVTQGGHLVMTESHLPAVLGAFAPVSLSREGDDITEIAIGHGRLSVLPGRFGFDPDVRGDPFARLSGFGAGIDQPLPRPSSSEPVTRRALDRILGEVALFQAGSNLHLITCRKARGEYTLGVFNPTWRPLPFEIRSRCGPIASIQELALDTSERGAVGHLPEGIEPSSIGANTDTVIAGGDVRVFAVRVNETNVVEIAHRTPPRRPTGRFLPLRRAGSLKEELLARPTFFEHFDGVVVDWRYLHQRERGALEAEAPWLKRQGLRLAVDFSSGLNLYPGLRLVDNLPEDYVASTNTIAEVLAKMPILGARDLILTLHRHPENNFTGQQTDASFEATLRELATLATGHGVTLHLRLAFGKPPWNLEAGLRWVERAGAANLKLAPSTALLVGQDPSPDLAARLAKWLGLWLVAAPRRDLAGQLWDAHAPLASCTDGEAIKAWLAVGAPNVPLVLDAVLSDQDEEYAEIRAIESLLGLSAELAAVADPAPPVVLGSRLELFVDDLLIERLDGCTLRLHEPHPANVALRFDAPWEGAFCGYVTVLHDGELFRCYYRGNPRAGRDGSDTEVTCYAESQDGIAFTKPALGLFEVSGTRSNNVVLAHQPPFSHNFAPFLDTRPGVLAAERFKALAGTSASGLHGFVSEDGVRWRRWRDEPLLTQGAFDSQNVAFWSATEQRYVLYFRTWTRGGFEGYRTISRATSTDFLEWSAPVEMGYGDTPREHLYTSQTHPYFRAPHLYVATPMRFIPGRKVLTAEQAQRLGVDPSYASDVAEAVFMTTRGGDQYARTFMEAFIRPGVDLGNWASRAGLTALGVVPTGEAELSLYKQAHYAQPTCHLLRYTLRTDGFVSVNAPYRGGELRTRPLTFTGRELVINFSTGAAGGVRVEVQDLAGQAVEGLALDESMEQVGDELERVVRWRSGSDVGHLAGQPARLRFVMRDADLYSIRFR